MKTQDLLAAALLMGIILVAMTVAFPKLAVLLSEVGTNYYEWGQKPNIVYREEPVSTSYTFGKDEYGRMVNGSLKCNEVIREDRIPPPQHFIDEFIKMMKDNGAKEVLYVKVHLTKEFAYWGGPEHSYAFYYVTLHIDECVFQADPLVIDDVLVAVLIITVVAGVLVFYFLWAYAPVVYHWAQVPPEDVLAYQLGQAVPMILWIFLVLAVGIIVLAYVKSRQAQTK